MVVLRMIRGVLGFVWGLVKFLPIIQKNLVPWKSIAQLFFNVPQSHDPEYYKIRSSLPASKLSITRRNLVCQCQ